MNVEIKKNSPIVNVGEREISTEIDLQNVSATVQPPTLAVTFGAGAVELHANPSIVRQYVGADIYDGEYTFTPKAHEAQTAETKNKFLTDDISVLKIPYFETSNQSGTTVYIANEVS